MSVFLFVIVHIVIGLAIIYWYGKIPKALTVFASVFLSMSSIYWATVYITLLIN